MRAVPGPNRGTTTLIRETGAQSAPPSLFVPFVPVVSFVESLTVDPIGATKRA